MENIERGTQNGGERGSENALSIFHLLCVAHLSARQQGSLALTMSYWLIHITKPQLRRRLRVNQAASSCLLEEQEAMNTKNKLAN